MYVPIALSKVKKLMNNIPTALFVLNSNFINDFFELHHNYIFIYKKNYHKKILGHCLDS